MCGYVGWGFTIKNAGVSENGVHGHCNKDDDKPWDGIGYRIFVSTCKFPLKHTKAIITHQVYSYVMPAVWAKIRQKIRWREASLESFLLYNHTLVADPVFAQTHALHIYTKVTKVKMELIKLKDVERMLKV